MTCALPVTPWHHFNDHLLWLPMDKDPGPSPILLDIKHSQGNVSPGSDTWNSSSSSGKRRISRAGTRSVTTLTVAQLERKRANDREAQRAVRERTKTHIDNLQRSINDLRGSREACEELVQFTQQRNRELEEENAYLRRRLDEAALSAEHSPPSYQKSAKHRLMSVPSTSTAVVTGSSIQGPEATSNSSAQFSNSPFQHALWQHQPEGLMDTAHTAIGLPSHAAIADIPNFAAWRLQSSPNTVQVHAGGPHHQDPCVDWSGNAVPCQQCIGQGQQVLQRYQITSMQQRGQQPSVKALEVSAPAQQATYRIRSDSQSDFSKHMGIIDFKHELPAKPPHFPTTIDLLGDTNAGAMQRDGARLSPRSNAAPCTSGVFFPSCTP